MGKCTRTVLLAALVLLAGCAAPAQSDPAELRAEYPLYQDQPTVDGGWTSVQERLDRVPIGVLATIVDGPRDVVLENRGEDGQRASGAMQPLKVRYERYALRVDTVIFGENPGGEIALYMPKASYVPAQEVDRRVGSRFYFNLARYDQERQQQLQTLLQCNGIQERLPIYQGGAAVYWTRQGVMLSAYPGDDQFDGMTKQQFVRAVGALARKRDAGKTLRLEYPKHENSFLKAEPLDESIGRADVGVMATVAADPQPLRLGGEGYVHFSLRIDTVVFGSLKARIIDLYLTQAQAEGIAPQPKGSRFFYALFSPSFAQRECLNAQLQAVGIAQPFPLLSGGPMFYITRYGTVLSITGEASQAPYDLQPQSQFLHNMRELRGHAKKNP